MRSNLPVNLPFDGTEIRKALLNKRQKIQIQSLDNAVAYLLKAKTVESEKQPLLGNVSVTLNTEVTIGSGVFVRSVPRLYNEDFDLITTQS
jgi:hypothetical protein